MFWFILNTLQSFSASQKYLPPPNFNRNYTFERCNRWNSIMRSVLPNCFRKMNMKNYTTTTTTTTTTTKQENVDKKHCIINISWLQVCITNRKLTVSGVWKQPIIIDWPMNFIQEWWALGELNNKGVVATSLGSFFYFTLFLSSFFAFYISGNFKR